MNNMAGQKPKTGAPKCGICGKQGKLRKTECCGNWICDDEAEYIPFSYERNSCSRNHQRYTLCGFHYAEGHRGHWKDCPECRKEFETEMYVWYGTNEYNFEKLDNPPAYRPTKCAICGRVIRLGTDNFTQSGGDYWCERCADKKLAKEFADRQEASTEGAPVTPKRVKIGRNDPCPCGSGKKYKRCCYGKQTAPASEEVRPVGALDELRHAVQDREFGSLEEAQVFIEGHTARKNQAPLDDFAGLSPEQMYRFLHLPFSSPDLVLFPSHLIAPPDSPMAKLFDLLLAAIGEDGLKATATGNLPLGFVRQSALTYLSDDEREFRPGIRSETDFFDLHATRVVSGFAGLVRKYRGRFVLTGRCRKLLSQGGMAAVYPPLFRAFTEKYNWAFRGLYPDFTIIQQSFLFSLWLFYRFGNEWRSPSFYEDHFLKAFPAILSEVKSERHYTTPEEIVRSCYTGRCLQGFAVFTGLLDIEWEKRGILNRSFRLRTTGLLNELVTFHL